MRGHAVQLFHNTVGSTKGREAGNDHFCGRAAFTRPTHPVCSAMWRAVAMVAALARCGEAAGKTCDDATWIQNTNIRGTPLLLLSGDHQQKTPQTRCMPALTRETNQPFALLNSLGREAVAVRQGMASRKIRATTSDAL
jgi:hypothetical protein